MSLTKSPKHIYEPTPLQCGQAVLAMLTDKTVDYVCSVLETERETTLKQMFSFLAYCNINCDTKRVEIKTKEELPDICILSLETPKCWHWSLYFHGKFYDPEYGVLDDFPVCSRKYRWEIQEE